jgi:hypothetical protein
MTTIYVLFAVAAVLWLFSVALGAVSLYCAWVPGRGHFPLAVVCSLLALLIGCLGTFLFHVTYSRTVNNSSWSLDSRWFFIVPLVLGVLALALALWRRTRSNPPAGLKGTPPDGGNILVR